MTAILRERAAAILFMAAAAYLGWEALRFPAGGHLFPLFSCAGIICVACVMLIRTWTAAGAGPSGKPNKLSFAFLKPFVITAATVLYVLSMYGIGFYTASLAYFVIMSLSAGVRDFRKIALAAVVVFPLLYLLFEVLLRTGMPRGILI